MVVQLESLLTLLPASHWITRQVVVFDWFDGPRQGVASLVKPDCEFFFELLAERRTPDDLDDRLFRISSLPPGAVEQVLSAIHSLGMPTNTVWVPVWKFSGDEERQKADREIDQIVSKRTPTEIVVYTRDMITFLGCWRVDRNESQANNWFSSLNIPSPE